MQSNFEENNNSYDLNDFISYCIYGNIEVVKSILSTPEEVEQIRHEYDYAFAVACLSNSTEFIKYFLNPVNSQLFNDIQLAVNAGLKEACEGGNIEVVKYLLTSNEMQCNADIQSANNIAVRFACSNENFEVAKYLLTSPELTVHSDINEAMNGACEYGELEMVKYLIALPEFKKHFSINDVFSNAFKFACGERGIEVLQYFIFDLKIEKTEVIKEYLNSFPNEKAINMFKIRELNKELNQELPLADIETKPKKNKI